MPHDGTGGGTGLLGESGGCGRCGVYRGSRAASCGLGDANEGGVLPSLRPGVPGPVGGDESVVAPE